MKTSQTVLDKKKQYYLENKNKILLKQKQYRDTLTDEQKENLKEVKREYYLNRTDEKKEQIKEQQNKYRNSLTEEDKQHRNEVQQEYYLKKKEQIKEQQKKYRDSLTEEQKKHRKEVQREYYAYNVETISDKTKIKYNDMIKCNCGLEVKKKYMKTHLTTNKHFFELNCRRLEVRQSLLNPHPTDAMDALRASPALAD